MNSASEDVLFGGGCETALTCDRIEYTIKMVSANFLVMIDHRIELIAICCVFLLGSDI
jgi:hypothetical protein